MTPEERQKLDELCEQVKIEKNHDRFRDLLRQINELFQRKDQRLGHTEEPEAD